MSENERNPYIILGIAFGTSRDLATAAFARKARRLRNEPGGDVRLTEMTWALNQIEEVVRDPRVAVHIYRVPADPGALEPDDLGGVLHPTPERMDRRTVADPSTNQQLIEAALGEGATAALGEYSTAIGVPER